MEGINPPEYDKILGLADSGYKTVVALALGYRSANDKYASLARCAMKPRIWCGQFKPDAGRKTTGLRPGSRKFQKIFVAHLISFDTFPRS